MKNEIYEIFSNELDSTIEGFNAEIKLGGIVFTQLPLLDNELFTNREKEVKLLANSLGNALKGINKKIIIYGKKGIGKTTLTNLIQIRANKEQQFYFARVPPLFYTADEEQFKSAVMANLFIIPCLDNLEKDRKRKDADKIKEKLSKILQTKNISKALEKACGLNLSKEITQKDTLSLFRGIIAHLNKPLIVFVDDFHLLYENRVNYNFLQKVLTETGLIEVIALPTKEYKEIIETNLNLSKNSIPIEVKEFSPEHLCLLFAKRIYRYKSQKIPKKIDLIKDILPFEKTALEKLALISQGNPLEFIINCENTYLKFIKTKDKSISVSFLERHIFKLKENKEKAGLSPNVTERQMQLYSILSENPEGISLRNLEKKVLATYNYDVSKARIVQQLNELIAKNLANRGRKGKEAYYYPKILKDN